MSSKNHFSQSANLLNTPQNELLEPLLIESSFLSNEIVYLCANEGQAKKCESRSKVAYTPDEVRILKAKDKTLLLQDYLKHLRAVHEIKKKLPGARANGQSFQDWTK
jgi:hypothetical protein